MAKNFIGIRFLDNDTIDKILIEALKEEKFKKFFKDNNINYDEIVDYINNHIKEERETIQEIYSLETVTEIEIGNMDGFTEEEIEFLIGKEFIDCGDGSTSNDNVFIVSLENTVKSDDSGKYKRELYGVGILYQKDYDNFYCMHSCLTDVSHPE